jgi:hypothetical protein
MPEVGLHQHSAQYTVPRDRSIGTAVSRVDPIITQKDKLTVVTFELLLCIKAVGRHSLRKIGFIEWFAIEENGPGAKLQHLPWTSDDTFDRKPVVGRIANDDYLPWAGSAHQIDPTVEEVPLGIVKCRIHAAADDLH